jgi:protein-tyrosine phosphatase
MKSILFICTGNVFRSMAAEYALKAHLGPEAKYVVASAGTLALPQAVPPPILDWLRERGVDPSAHKARRLTRELLASTDFPVAMSLDHRDFIRLHFEREVLLFNQACHEREEPVLDIHEAIPDWHANMDAAQAYALSVIEHIWKSMPCLLTRLPELMSERQEEPSRSWRTLFTK